MAGKSRRGRHLPRSKRRKGKGVSSPQAQPAVVAPQVEPPRADEPVVPSAKAPPPKVAVAGQTAVVAELKRIGILSGVILVILVVLAVVLS